MSLATPACQCLPARVPVEPQSQPSPPMSYQLTLRLNATTPVTRQALREKLMLAGLWVQPDAVPFGMLGDGLARFEIIADPDAPAGVSVAVQIPNGHKFVDVTIELLHLERIAGVIEADVIDGDEVIVHCGQQGLASLFAFLARYERASTSVTTSVGVA